MNLNNFYTEGYKLMRKKNRKLPNLHIRGIFDMLECCYDVILQGSICLTVIGYFFYCIFQWQLALQPSKKLVILYSLWVLAVMIWLCLSAMWMEIKLSWISMMFQPLEVLYVVLLQNDTVLWHSFVNCLFCFVLFYNYDLFHSTLLNVSGSLW